MDVIKTQPDNKFYTELVAILNSNSLPDILGWMAHHSQSLILNYGEDNRQWEAAWIISDIRFWSVRETPMQALKDILNEVRTEMLEIRPAFDEAAQDD